MSEKKHKDGTILWTMLQNIKAKRLLVESAEGDIKRAAHRRADALEELAEYEEAYDKLGGQQMNIPSAVSQFRKLGEKRSRGPWEVVEYHIGNIEIRAFGSPMAEMVMWAEEFEEERNANARFIAQSPNILSTLLEAHELIEKLVGALRPFENAYGVISVNRKWKNTNDTFGTAAAPLISALQSAEEHGYV